MVRVLIRLLTAFLIAALVALSGASIASAEGEDDPSGAEIAAGAVTCVMPGLGTIGEAVDAAAEMAGSDSPLPTCTEALSAGASAAVDGAKELASRGGRALAESLGETAVEMMEFGLTWWTDAPTGPSKSTYTGITMQVTAYTKQLQLAAMILSIILIAGRLVMARSGAIRDTSEEGLRTVTRASLVSGGIVAAITAGLTISDGISTWIINGMVSDTAGLAKKMIPLSEDLGGLPIALLFVVGIVGILGSLVLMFLLLLRAGLLIVVTAAMPIAAAASGTGTGSQSFNRMLSWTIAFLLFKPVGSLVIGVAWITFEQAATGGTNDMGTLLMGTLLLCSTAFVLPGLMRLVAPSVATLGGGGSGAAALAGAASVVGGTAKAVGGAAMTAAGFASGGAGAVAGMAASRSSGGAPTGSAPPSFGTRGALPSGGGGGRPPGGNNPPPPPNQPAGRWSLPSGTGSGGFRR